MEPTKTQRPNRILTAAVLGTLAAGLVFYWATSRLQATRLHQMVRSDLPVLDLELEFIDAQGEKVPPDRTRLGGKPPEPRAKTPEPSPEECPELVGGDRTWGLQPSLDEKRPDHCPKTARWKVRRHPVAFSLYFLDGPRLLSFLENDPRAKELVGSKLVQGLFYDPIHAGRVRARDLQLEGIEGAVLSTLFREALAARAELHYDMSHGRKGFVFSFVRNECPFASRLLPLIGARLARSGYRIPSLKEPVLEMRIGPQRLFLTQVEDRVYLANSLEGLLNVLESLPPRPVDLPKTPLVLTMRGEAFLEKVLPVLFGSETWQAHLGIGLSAEDPGVVEFPLGKAARHLSPRIFKGVLAGIPRDVFASAAAGFHIPPDMTPEQWRRLAVEGPGEPSGNLPGEAGVALVWDLSSQDGPITQVGLAVAAQTAPDKAEGFKRYLADPELTAVCGGGTVFLAASSRNLLVRMKESCEAQSLSVLDWDRGPVRDELEKAQVFVSLNPGAGLKELLLAGGAKAGDTGDFAPEWKQQYEKAKEAMRFEGEWVSRALPVLAYAGSGGLPNEPARLKQVRVREGGSR